MIRVKYGIQAPTHIANPPIFSIKNIKEHIDGADKPFKDRYDLYAIIAKL